MKATASLVALADIASASGGGVAFSGSDPSPSGPVAPDPGSLSAPGFSSSGAGKPGKPPICTGVAAPRLVPGAIAATWVA